MPRCTRLALTLALFACGAPSRGAAPASGDALVSAVRADSGAAVTRLLAEGADPDAAATDGGRPLVEAARLGRAGLVAALLGAGADPALTDADGMTAFDGAMTAGDLAALAHLVRRAARDAGAGEAAMAWFDALAAGRTPATPWPKVLDGELAALGLMAALLHGNDPLTGELRRAGGIPNRTGWSPMALAARFGRETQAGWLLSAGANPEEASRGGLGTTPLMEAARDGHAALGRRLLRAGARHGTPDRRGDVPLHWAIRSGHAPFVRMLLEAGADPDRPGRGGETPRALAARLGRSAMLAAGGGR